MLDKDMISSLEMGCVPHSTPFYTTLHIPRHIRQWMAPRLTKRDVSRKNELLSGPGPCENTRFVSISSMAQNERIPLCVLFFLFYSTQFDPLWLHVWSRLVAKQEQAAREMRKGG